MVIGTTMDVYYNDMFNQHENDVKMMVIEMILLIYQK
jgi:hypothetical protein